jgi:hypothetical protein
VSRPVDASLPCGNLLDTSVVVLAGRCADRIAEFAKPRAVTLDPDGRVYVEAVKDAAECDMVGVYTCTVGTLLLTRQIRDDLLHEKQTRGFIQRRRRNAASAVIKPAQVDA